MVEVSPNIVRDIITNSFSVDRSGYEFNTQKALSSGYTEAEIEEADKILLSNDWLSIKRFEIRDYLNYAPRMANLNVLIIYIEAIQLIFLVNQENQHYTFLFEEDLRPEVAELLANNSFLWY